VRVLKKKSSSEIHEMEHQLGGKERDQFISTLVESNLRHFIYFMHIKIIHYAVEINIDGRYNTIQSVNIYMNMSVLFYTKLKIKIQKSQRYHTISFNFFIYILGN
jgi:hypothetical protein